MPSPTTTAVASTGARQQHATRLVFFIAGFFIAGWAPLVPLVKARAALDEGTLGVLLLCLGMGSIIAMPLAGKLVAMLGCRRVISAGVLLAATVLPLLTLLHSLPLLVLAITCFGVGMGALDCAMNVQAVVVNAASERPIISSFHGLFSLGGILGAVAMTALLAQGVSPFAGCLVVVAVTLLALYAAAPGLLVHGGGGANHAFALPRGSVLWLGALCFVVFLSEGALLDWGGLFLVEARGIDARYSGVGYSAFALAMTLGRLVGDRLVERYGAPAVAGIGGLVAALGFALALAWATLAGALLGFAAVGVGCANIVPILFSCVARQRSMPVSTAVPAMTTLGYAGVLLGPALIGFIAHTSSLQAAMALVGAGLLAVAASSRALKHL